MKDELRYFTFPICLLDKAFDDIKKVCNNIMDYAIYNHSLKLELGKERERMQSALKYYAITAGSLKNMTDNGKLLNNSIPERTPLTSINKSMIFDFYGNSKSEYDITCFLAFASIKSILGKSTHSHAYIDLVLNRMAGNSKFNDILPDYLLKYKKEYHWKKLIKELEKNWHLKYYSRYTKGFNISFDLSLEDLIVKAEAKRKSNSDKIFTENKAKIIKTTLEKLKK